MIHTLVGGPRRSAVIDPPQSLSLPSEVRNYRAPVDLASEQAIEELELRNEDVEESAKEFTIQSEKEPIADEVLDENLERDDLPPSIHEVAVRREDADCRDEPVTPQRVLKLLDRIQDRFVSTMDVAAALGCAPEAAHYALTELTNSQQVRQSTVISDEGERLKIWYRTE